MFGKIIVVLPLHPDNHTKYTITHCAKNEEF